MKNKVLCIAIAVVLWFSIISCATAQEPYEGNISFHWDLWGEIAVEDPIDVINQCVAEVRQGGEVVDMVTMTVSDCIPLESPFIGQCGSDISFTLAPPFGKSEIWIRCVWIADGAVLEYLTLDPPTTMDEDHFWLYESIERWRILNVPTQYRNAGP